MSTSPFRDLFEGARSSAVIGNGMRWTPPEQPGPIPLEPFPPGVLAELRTPWAIDRRTKCEVPPPCQL